MIRLACSILCVLLAPSSLLAAEIVSVGMSGAFSGPNIPYDPTEEHSWSFSLGYGDPSNTVGDEVWFSEAGVYDLSADPDLPGFLEYATNGIDDEIYITVRDEDGFSSIWPFHYPGSESMWLGVYEIPTDLADVNPAGVQLRVSEVFAWGGEEGQAGALVQWEFLGVPEPATGLLILAVIMIRVQRRLV
jgi:hypothetical protein